MQGFACALGQKYSSRELTARYRYHAEGPAFSLASCRHGLRLASSRSSWPAFGKHAKADSKSRLLGVDVRWSESEALDANQQLSVANAKR